MDALAPQAKKKSGKDAVAVVYVEGAIMTGEGEASPLDLAESMAYSTPIRKALDDVAADDSVKAVVLRVDSPGGSARGQRDHPQRHEAGEGQEAVRGLDGPGGRERRLLRGLRRGHDLRRRLDDHRLDRRRLRQVRHRRPVGQGRRRLALRQARRRGRHSGLRPGLQPRREGQAPRLHGRGLRRVQEARHRRRGSRLKKPIDELAGGRVFTGKQALDLGLVDKLGTLDDAIQSVAKQAGLKDYEVRVVPRPKSFLEGLFSDLSDRDSDSKELSTAPSAAARWLSPRQPNTLLEMALPLLKGVEPARLQAIKSVLARMTLLQQERVILMMPEVRFGD